MDSIRWVIALSGIVMTAFGLYVFGVGLWGLTKKRPLVFSARQFMWFLIAMYIPIVILSFRPLFASGRPGDSFFLIMPIFLIANFALVVFVYWRQMTGYMIFGVSDETFREALTSGLNKLNLPFQETISKIKLTGIDADLQVAVASWMGTAQIRMEQRDQIRYAKDIAQAMDEYYKNNAVKMNKVVFVLYLIMGILIITFVVAFVIFGYGLLSRF